MGIPDIIRFTFPTYTEAANSQEEEQTRLHSSAYHCVHHSGETTVSSEMLRVTLQAWELVISSLAAVCMETAPTARARSKMNFLTF